MLDIYKKLTDTASAHLIKADNGVPVIKFKPLESLSWLSHGFSTRLGGVSTDTFASMNLSFGRGDDDDRVMKNFSLFGEAVGIRPEHMVFSRQTHTTNVRIVTAADRGQGIIRPREYEDVDGLITNEPSVALVTFYADCVPLFFADTKNHVIGASHSGWRGTVARMGQATIGAMHRNFGTNPENLITVVGPSVCRHCYEVSKDVADAFMTEFDRIYWDRLLTDKGGGKYMLDLWAANALILEQAGVPEENIYVSGICTHCHPELLWSHRSLGNARGSLAGFMQIKDENHE